MQYLFCFARISFSVIHFVFSCVGVGYITFGCSILRNLKQVDAGQLHYEIPMALIAVGLGLVFLSLLGFAASFQGSYWLAAMYSILLLAMFCCQLILVGYVGHTKDELANDMKNLLHAHFKEKFEYGVSRITPLDTIQNVFKCCGKRSFLDYLEKQLPSSCCAHLNCSLVKNIYKHGCDEQFSRFWIYQSEFMKYSGIFFAGLEFIGVLIGFISTKSYKKETHTQLKDVELVPSKIMAYN